jgi:PAS domain S-box-containing protein
LDFICKFLPLIFFLNIVPNKRLIYPSIIYLNITTVLSLGVGLCWFGLLEGGIALLALGGATLWVYLKIRIATRATTFKIEQARNLENYTHQLFELSKSEAVQAGDCDGSLALFSEVISQTLGISRVSFWAYDTEAQKLACTGEYSAEGFHNPEALYIQEEEAPRYLAAIREEKIIAAANARLHPLTREFATYFQQNNIYALLDVPYHLDGRLAGIICCEHEAIREWKPEEVLFVKSVADLFTLVMKSHEKKRFQQDLQQNIEELQSSQRQLAEREQQIFKFLNAIPYGVQVINAQAHSVFVNEAGQRLLPMLMEELDIAEIQRQVFQAESGLPYPLEAFPIIKALHEKQEAYADDMVVRRSSGSTATFEVSASPIFNEQGEVVFAISVFQDISTRKQQEAALQKSNLDLQASEEELRQTNEELQTQRDYITRINQEILDKNQTLTQYTNALLALSNRRRIYQQSLEKSLEEILLKATKQLGIGRGSIWLIDEAQECLFCLKQYDQEEASFGAGSILPLATHQQYISKVRSQGLLIANNALTHPDLQEISRNYLQEKNISATLDMAFFINEQLEGLLSFEQQGPAREWTAEDVFFVQSLGEIITVMFQASQIKEETELVKEKSRQIERQNQTLARNQAELEAAKAALEHQNQKLITNEAILKKAVQKMREQEAALRQNYEKLQKAQIKLVESEKMSALGQLTAGIAHELNNPINYIHSSIEGLDSSMAYLLEMMQRYETIREGNATEVLSEIQAYKQKVKFDKMLAILERTPKNVMLGAQRAAEIVRELRSFSRIDEAELKASDLHEGINSTLVLLRHQYKDHIQIHREYTDLPLIECYPGKLNQVWMNLLANAIEAIHMRPEGVSFPGKIYIRSKLYEEEVLIEIEDNGIGMKEEVQARIFEPFFTTKAAGKGVGLGMAIAKSIIEQHQGSIYYTSSEAQGTTFFIRLPLQRKVQHLHQY